MTHNEAKAAWDEAWLLRGLGLDRQEQRRDIEFDRWWTRQQEPRRQKRQGKEAAKIAQRKALVAEYLRRSQINLAEADRPALPYTEE